MLEKSNAALIEAIHAHTPQHSNPASLLMDMLNIGREAAYRRLRGEVPFTFGEASALSAIGCLRYIIRDIENARKALMKSVYLYGKVAHHFAEAESLLYLARVEAYDKEHGDFDRAKAHYKRSIEL